MLNLLGYNQIKQSSAKAGTEATMKLFVRFCMILLGLGMFAETSSAQTNNTTTNRDTPTKRPVYTPPVRKKRPKPISREFSAGFRANTDGWSIFADKGYVIEPSRNTEYFYDVRIFQVEFGEKKHPKEKKSSNRVQSRNGTNSVMFYGKANSFYTFKLGYGKRKMIAGKPDPGAVSIHWVYLAGLSLGLEKPYYINATVLDPQTGVRSAQNIKYTPETEEDFLDPNYINGYAGFTEGIGETKFVPGIHAKTGLHFDFANNKKKKFGVETGINAELYTRPIQIMVDPIVKARPYFINVYLSAQFGGRKAKS